MIDYDFSIQDFVEGSIALLLSKMLNVLRNEPWIHYIE